MLGWLASPKEAHQHWKMAQKEIVVVETDDKTSLPVATAGAPMVIAGCEAVMTVLV